MLSIIQDYNPVQDVVCAGNYFEKQKRKRLLRRRFAQNQASWMFQKQMSLVDL